MSLWESYWAARTTPAAQFHPSWWGQSAGLWCGLWCSARSSPAHTTFHTWQERLNFFKYKGKWDEILSVSSRFMSVGKWDYFSLFSKKYTPNKHRTCCNSVLTSSICSMKINSGLLLSEWSSILKCTEYWIYRKHTVSNQTYSPWL